MDGQFGTKNYSSFDLFFSMTSLVLQLLSAHLEDPNVNDFGVKERWSFCDHYLSPPVLDTIVLRTKHQNRYAGKVNGSPTAF